MSAPAPGRAAPAVGAVTRDLLQAADDTFVRGALDLQTDILAASARVLSAGLDTVPAALDGFARAFTLLSAQTQPLAASTSVLAASLPAAAQRTARVLEHLAAHYRTAARITVAALCDGGRTKEESIADEYRAIGTEVAEAVRDGLDPYVIARALRQRLRRLRQLQAGRQREPSAAEARR